MSDGHFNRSLLPRTDYQSGYRAGQAAMRRQAEAVFRHVMQTEFPHLSTEEQEAVCRAFKEGLNQ